MSNVNFKIKDISEVKNGSTPSTSNPAFYDGDIIWITPKDLSVQNSKYISKGERTITRAGYESCSASLLPKGTILLSSRAPIGLLSIAATDLCTNQGFKNIIPDQSKIDSEYLYYYLKIKIKDIERLGSGTTFKEVSKNSIDNFHVIIPDKVEYQKQIACILSSLDSKIELNNRINIELEAMAKTLYDFWFVQFDFPDSNGKPYKISGGNMVWNKDLKREIPEDWQVRDLGSIINIFDSKRIPLSNMQREKMQGKYPYHGATGIMDYVNDYIFDGEYILLAEDGSVMDEKGFPIVQYIWGKTWVNNHAHVMRPKDKSNNDYLFYLLKSISVVQIMTGSIQKKINQDNLVNVKIAFPNESILKQFSNFAIPVRKRIINIIEENQQLSSLRDWLLPMLMNGQVKVKDTVEETLSIAAEEKVKYQ